MKNHDPLIVKSRTMIHLDHDNKTTVIWKIAIRTTWVLYCTHQVIFPCKITAYFTVVSIISHHDLICSRLAIRVLQWRTSWLSQRSSLWTDIAGIYLNLLALMADSHYCRAVSEISIILRSHVRLIMIQPDANTCLRYYIFKCTSRYLFDKLLIDVISTDTISDHDCI